jgi:hypothetical protein
VPHASLISRLNRALGVICEDVPAGEYWIDDTGFTYDADDGMHETVALDSMFGDETKARLWASGEIQIEEVPPEEQKEYEKEIEFYIAHGGLHGRAATEYMLIHRGWIRLINGNMEMYGVTDDKLRRAANALADLGDIEELETSQDEIYVDDLATRRSFSTPLGSFLDKPEVATLRP